MNWRDANDFFSMGGYALYVWGAYGAMAAAMAIEPVLVVLRHRAARAVAASEAEARDFETPAETRRGAPAEARQ